MEYIISNGILKATIDSNGGELISLKDSNGKERMHQKDVNTWNGTSTILFPFISRFKDNHYFYQGKEYQTRSHGFFRYIDHKAESKTDSSITFKLVSNEETKKLYPFDFEMILSYVLENNKISFNFEVTNNDNKDMLYMIGGHPGFIIPFNKDETYDDYYVKFECKETVDAMQVIDDHLANVFKRALTNSDEIDLHHSLFVPDAVILCNLKSKYVLLKSHKSDYELKFNFEGFEKLAFWSKTYDYANFVCFEPWNGIQTNFVSNLEEMGTYKLSPKETKKFSFSIEIIK